MASTENPVFFQLPVLENPISPSELEDLFSLLRSEPTVQSTCSSETNRPVYSMEERKRRRMISNRESARRSRWQKKKHFEDLTNELNRFRLENRELKNWLCALAHDCHLVQSDSNRMLTESICLRQKLSGLHEILAPNRLL